MGEYSGTPNSPNKAVTLRTTDNTFFSRVITMAGKFEIYEDKSGQFRFRLKAGNGEIIAVGEAYKTKAGARKGVESVMRNAVDASIVDV